MHGYASWFRKDRSIGEDRQDTIKGIL